MGPAKYQPKGIDRSIKNPTIPRATFRGDKKSPVSMRSPQTIKDNYEELGEDGNPIILPGPGAYLQAF